MLQMQEKNVIGAKYYWCLECGVPDIPLDKAEYRNWCWMEGLRLPFYLLENPGYLLEVDNTSNENDKLEEEDRSK